MRRCASCGKRLSDNEYYCNSCGSTTDFDSSETYEKNRSKYYGARFEDEKPKVSNIATNNASLYNTPDIKINWRGCAMGCLAFIGFIILLILWSCGAFKFNKTYKGDGYKLTYKDGWSLDNYDGTKALKVKKEKAYLIPLDTFDVSDFVDCDFSKKDCKDQLFDEYYNELISKSNDYVEQKKDFTNLKEDIYYATYSYGKDSKNITGYYYLIVSKDNEYIITFKSTSSTKKVNSVNKKVLKLFDSIEITK